MVPCFMNFGYQTMIDLPKKDNLEEYAMYFQLSMTSTQYKYRVPGHKFYSQFNHLTFAHGILKKICYTWDRQVYRGSDEESGN